MIGETGFIQPTRQLAGPAATEPERAVGRPLLHQLIDLGQRGFPISLFEQGHQQGASPPLMVGVDLQQGSQQHAGLVGVALLQLQPAGEQQRILLL